MNKNLLKVKMDDSLMEYKKYVKERLEPVSEILANIAAGDFSKTLIIPKHEDIFTELYVGLTFMMEDLLEHLKEREEAETALKRHKEELELLVKQRTKELELVNKKLKEDILERKNTEEALRDSEEMYRSLINTLPDAVTTTDLEGNITYVSPTTLKLHGIDSDKKIIGKNALKLVAPEDHERAIDNLRRTLKEDVVKNLEYKLLRVDGSTFTGLLSAGIIRDSSGNPKSFIASVKDISERKKVEEQIKKSLREKDILLREIHHRVKNNIQVITSMLNLHTKYIDDKKYTELIKEMQLRIWSMALIHEKLYMSEDISNINFNEYIKELVNELFRSYGANINLIKPQIIVKDISFGLDTAIPCGLIINELVSNSLKHAFPNRQNNIINIELSKEEKKFKLYISDNGIGLPKSFKIENTKTFGLQLVDTLVKQIKGDLEISSTYEPDENSGTHFSIVFPEPV
jgi:PAS domain S-box-containing protein